MTSMGEWVWCSPQTPCCDVFSACGRREDDFFEEGALSRVGNPNPGGCTCRCKATTHPHGRIDTPRERDGTWGRLQFHPRLVSPPLGNGHLRRPPSPFPAAMTTMEPNYSRGRRYRSRSRPPPFSSARPMWQWPLLLLTALLCAPAAAAPPSFWDPNEGQLPDLDLEELTRVELHRIATEQKLRLLPEFVFPDVCKKDNTGKRLVRGCHSWVPGREGG